MSNQSENSRRYSMLELVQAAHEVVAGLKFWLVVVDSSGAEVFSSIINHNLEYTPEMPQSKYNAFFKAHTAASRKEITGFTGIDLEKSERSEYLANLRQNPNFTNLMGGLPIIKYDNSDITHLGGLGISGFTPKEDLNVAIKILQRCGYYVDINSVKRLLPDYEVE